MDSILLPWTTRGVPQDKPGYLSSFNIRTEQDVSIEFEISSDMPFTAVAPILTKMRREGRYPLPLEYGCFDLNGTLMGDISLAARRQSRNILYYTIAGMLNNSRRVDQYFVGASIESDPVSSTPLGNWAALVTDMHEDLPALERAIAPLVEKRSGMLKTMPKMNPDEFVPWVADLYNSREYPHYWLICDSFENIPLEYQFIFNSFAVTGRLHFDEIEDYGVYVEKVLAFESGRAKCGRQYTVASPADDPVTKSDCNKVISALMNMNESLPVSFRPLLKSNFNKSSLLEQAKESRFLALYCHGLGLPEEKYAKEPDLQGAFVMDFEHRDRGNLVAPRDIECDPFVPGGIVFSPACLSGGTQGHSDFVAWIQDDELAPYLGVDTRVSQIGQDMLISPTGPLAALLHFDISFGSEAPMVNPYSEETGLQSDLHSRFLRNLIEGQTLGQATNPFRWAAGAFYAQAIYIFGQVMGHKPYIGVSGQRKTIGNFIHSMNMYHVTATDMRNYIILGDPAVRFSNS